MRGGPESLWPAASNAAATVPGDAVPNCTGISDIAKRTCSGKACKRRVWKEVLGKSADYFRTGIHPFGNVSINLGHVSISLGR